MNVFIDTNTFLNFFDFSNEDLEELRKIVVLQTTGKIRLILTQQVVDEFNRNRENKIQNALKEFSKADFAFFPQMIKSYAEYTTLEKAKRDFQSAKQAILNKLDTEKHDGNLRADTVITQIFASAQCIEINDVILAKALKRKHRGNPPGKKSETMGDQINWESLLSDFPRQDSRIQPDPYRNDLHIITSDKDWASDFDDERPRPFLEDEWKKRSSGNLFLYKRISVFILKFFPEIELAAEFEKELTVSDLLDSWSFQRTHQVIGKLSDLGEFNKPQVDGITDAYLSNSQVSSIITDDDVLDFLGEIIERCVDLIEPEKKEQLVDALPTRILNDDEKNKQVARLKSILSN